MSTPNCLFDLETQARNILCNMIKDSVQNIYGIDLKEKDAEEYIYKYLTRPKIKKGHIVFQCKKLSSKLDVSNEKLILEIAEDFSKKLILKDSVFEKCEIVTKQKQDFTKKNKKKNKQKNKGIQQEKNPNELTSSIDKVINLVKNWNIGSWSEGEKNINEAVPIYLLFYLNPNYLAQIIDLILNDNDSYLSPLPSKGEKVMIEFSQPNTHKAFHVGHLRNCCLGDALIRLFKHCGYAVIAANYFGDEGAHIAKCLWKLKEKIDDEKLDLNKIETTEGNKGEWLGNLYTEAHIQSVLKTYTKFPYPGVVAAKILSIKNLSNDTNMVVIEYKDNTDAEIKQVSVICDGDGYDIGNFVAYVPVGQKFKKFPIEKEKEIDGVICKGRILKSKDIGIDHKQSVNEIFVMDQFISNTLTKIDDTLVEIGKYDKFKDIEDIEKFVKQYKEEQNDILKKLEDNDEEIVNLWSKTKQWSLDEFHENYKWLDISFDVEYFESECSKGSKEIVQKYKDQGLFVEKDGAIGIYLPKKKKKRNKKNKNKKQQQKEEEQKEQNRDFCVLLKSNGTGLYATKDLYLALKKFEQFNLDKSIYVIDSAQKQHIEQVFEILKLMDFKQSEQCYHLSYGFVGFPSEHGKNERMSSSKGTVILFSKLKQKLENEIRMEYFGGGQGELTSSVDQIIDLVKNWNKTKGQTTGNCKKSDDDDDIWSEKEINEAIRHISNGVIKHGMLNVPNKNDLTFDLKKWCLNSGNTGPYLMLNYARIKSILRKVKYPNMDIKDINYSVLSEDIQAQQILFEMAQFQKKILEICEKRNLSSLCDYLYSMCRLFSQWYGNPDHSIKLCKDFNLKVVRLNFCQAAAKCVETGMKILGITPLERM